MEKDKTTEERIESLPPIFKQRIEGVKKTDLIMLDWEVAFCEQAVIIISYVEKKKDDEFLRSGLTSDEYKKFFPLREEMILWQISCRLSEGRKISIPELSTELYSASLMMARLYFSNHSEDIITLHPGIWLF